MPRGAPDYLTLDTQTVRVEQGSINQSVYDIGFSRLDGGGRVVWFDDFRSGMNRYTSIESDGGLAPALNFDEGKMYGFSPSVKFNPAVNGGISGFESHLPYIQSGKVGLEFSIFMPTSHGQVNIGIATSVPGAFGHFFGVRIEETTNKVYLIKQGGVELVYTPVSPGLWNNKFVGMKMIVDPDGIVYDKLLFSTVFIDVSTVAGVNNFSSVGDTMYFTFDTTAQSAVLLQPVYLGYVALSVDEP